MEVVVSRAKARQTGEQKGKGTELECSPRNGKEGKNAEDANTASKGVDAGGGASKAKPTWTKMDEQVKENKGRT